MGEQWRWLLLFITNRFRFYWPCRDRKSYQAYTKLEVITESEGEREGDRERERDREIQDYKKEM